MPIEYSAHFFNYEDYFRRSAEFLGRHRWIYEQSNTKFVQAGILDALPRTWIDDFRRASNEELNQMPLGRVNEAWCNDLKQFLRTVDSLRVECERKCDSCGENSKMIKGISPKKLYEIQNLTSLIGEVCDRNETFLDFGSGLGYLSQSLHSVYQCRVLGLEGDRYRVQAAQQRQTKFFRDSMKQVKYAQHFIEEDTFERIQESLKSEFPEESNLAPLAIVGLHACADLSISAIKMFLLNDSISKLVIMPCCYHKLTFDSNGTMFKNFPLSDQLKDALEREPNFIGRPFLRLGCQQTSARWKTMTAEEHVSHGLAMFERSLMEAIIESGQRVTKRKDTSSSILLETYQLCDETGTRLEWNDRHRKRLEELCNKYSEGGQLAEYLTCLQTCLQPICENLILLERMCYIETEARRRNISIRSKLVKFANDNLSPRCFVITAEKDYVTTSV
nr:protein RRNAD1-like [Aedes albopictus]